MLKSREQAEIVALHALGWLAGNEELLPVFLGASGAAPAELRDRAAEAEFLGAVLDFLLMNDDWVLECAAACGQAPESFQQARVLLPGAARIDWG